MNLKPVGLLQTPAPAQRSEVLSIDLFGPLPETLKGNRWILIICDTVTKWVELFPLPVASAEAYARVLIDEVFLRYGTPRRIISDNGVQFVRDVMQKVAYCFDIKMPFIPLYHPESNPVKRKNRDLKTQLAILTKDLQGTWDEYLNSIRFAMNSTVTSSTGYTPAFLTFGREMRAPRDPLYDFTTIVESENFVPRITPYLKKLAVVLREAKDRLTQEQDRRKSNADQSRRPLESLKEGDKILLKTHALSNAAKGVSAKLMPKRDGPYLVIKVISPTTYEVASCDDPTSSLGRYHISDIVKFVPRDEEEEIPVPVVPKRGQGRPRKKKSPPVVLADTGGRCAVQRGSV